MSLIRKLKKVLFGYDIFISYSRKDSLDYAYAIARHFMDNGGYECYIDQLSSVTPGRELPPNIRHAVSRSTAFVLIGSKESQVSVPIKDEIDLFLKDNKNKPLIPVTVNGAIGNDAIWYESIRGLALIDDTAENLRAGKPAADVVDRIGSALKFTKKSARLRAIAFAILLAAIVLTAYTFWQSNQATVAKREAGQAKLARIEADRLKSQALREKDTAMKLASDAKDSMDFAIKEKAIAVKDMEAAQQLASAARNDALKSQRIAKSNFLALSAYNSKDIDPTLTYGLSSVAYETAPENSTSYGSLIQSLQGSPFYKNRIYMKDLAAFDFSPDGKTMALLKSNYDIVLLDLDTEEQRVISNDKEKGGTTHPAIEFSPDGQYIITRTPHVFIWTKDGKFITGLKRIITTDDDDPYVMCDSVFFTKQGNYIVTSSEEWGTDKIIKQVWNTQGEEVKKEITDAGIYKRTPEHYNNYSLQVNGKDIAVSEDGINQTASVLKGHYSAVTNTRFSRDGQLIGSYGDDDYLIIWNNKNYRDPNINQYTDVKVEPASGYILATREQDVFLTSHALKDFRSDAVEFVITESGFAGKIPYVTGEANIAVQQGDRWENYTAGGTINEVLKTSDLLSMVIKTDGSVELLDLRKRKISLLHRGEYSDVVISTGSMYIGVKDTSGNGTVYDFNGRMALKKKDISKISFTPDGNHILIERAKGGSISNETGDSIHIQAPNDVDAELYTLSGKKIWAHHDNVPFKVEFNGDWRRAVVANALGDIKYIDIRSGRVLKKQKFNAFSTGTAFSPNGKKFLFLSPVDLSTGFEELFGAVLVGFLTGDYEINLVPRLWDLSTNKVFEFKGPKITMANAEFAPGGKVVVTTDHEKNVTLWNVATGRPLVLVGHYKKIKNVKFSDNGKWILTQSADNSVKLWDMDGNEIYSIQDEPGTTIIDAGFYDQSGYIYIKAEHTRIIKEEVPEGAEKPFIEKETEEKNIGVVFKLIDPERIIGLIDKEKKLGPVWKMDEDVKTKFRLR